MRNLQAFALVPSYKKMLQQDSSDIAACMLSSVLASLFIADVPDAEVPLQAGSAVVRTAQVGSDTNTLAADAALNQALAADSNAKPQVL